MARFFIEKFSRLMTEKNTILCIGLDPALPGQRRKDTIPPRYLEGRGDVEARLAFCLDILDVTAEYALAAKPNEQYFRGFGAEQHRVLARRIRDLGLISIYDCKLNDIGDTIESALFHIHSWGYDAVTVNPLPGNIKEIVKIAHSFQPGIGVFVLTLMSNPEAARYMKETTVSGRPFYLAVAEDVERLEANGCVVAATGHVTTEDIRRVRTSVGEDKVLLIPGIGAQRGDPEKVVVAGGRHILINVGRAIIYDVNPEGRAEEYKRLFNQIRQRREPRW